MPSAETSYPGMQRFTTQLPARQATSATPGMAVQSTPSGDESSRGIAQPPPIRHVRKPICSQSKEESAKQLTAFQVRRSVDALPCAPNAVCASINTAGSHTRAARRTLAYRRGLVAVWLPARARLEGPTEAIADLERGLADAVGRPLFGLRFEAVLALKAARSPFRANGLGVVGVVTGFVILRGVQL